MMKIHASKIGLAIATVTGLCFASAAAYTSQPLANAGKLTCTMAPLPNGAPIDTPRDLSCRFQPIAGQPAALTGQIKRSSGAPLSETPIVLVWTVLAQKSDVPPKNLSGRYLSVLSPTGSTSAAKVPSLRRKATAPIELRAQTPLPNDESRQIIVLELELRGLRA